MYLMPEEHWREERLKVKPQDMHLVWHESRTQRCCPIFFFKFSKQTGVSAIIFFSIAKQEVLSCLMLKAATE